MKKMWGNDVEYIKIGHMKKMWGNDVEYIKKTQ